jgi:hypothetical protein
MIDENQPIPPKRRGPRGVGRPIQIQERDLDILYSLSVGRYLTVPAIEWLHYPGWRERYKAYLDTTVSGADYRAPLTRGAKIPSGIGAADDRQCGERRA